MARFSVTVPRPCLVRVPVPLISPVRVTALPSVSRVPPPLLRVMARLLVKLPEKNNVPPLKEMPPVPSPKLLSAPTCTMPPLMAVPPV